MNKNFRLLKSQLSIRILSAVAVVLWMGVIFFFSSQNSNQSAATSGVIEDAIIGVSVEDFDSKTPYEKRIISETVYYIVRNSAHFICFAVLGALSFVALYTYRIKKIVRTIISFLFGTCYATLDEVHQIYVPGRTFQLEDIGFDAVGVLAGVLVALLMSYVVAMRKLKRTEVEK